MAKTIVKAITGASFLFVVILSLLFLYAQSFQSSGIYSQDTDLWNKILTGYLVIFAISLIGAYILDRETVNKLATANYWKTFGLRFIPTAIVSILFFVLIRVILKGANHINIFEAISYIPIPVLLFHLFVVSQVEELLFGGLIFKTIKKRGNTTAAYLLSAVLFSLWHYAKSGGSIAIMITYFPLRFIFNYASQEGIPGLRKIFPNNFGPTQETQQAGAAVHFAWNAFIVGFIENLKI
ncbi:MAG: CPBP family intramembrane glutamic endopeptidase [Candidatus Paceibacterota bacterium]|jgi:membrane protease YdiL (CAAX protease family)